MTPAGEGLAVDGTAAPDGTSAVGEEALDGGDAAPGDMGGTAREAPPVEGYVVSEAVHRSMQGNKRSDTKPELLMRRELRAAGYPGYRLQWKKVPGHPDIAYPGRKVAIFINGCFWHHHEGCKYATTPKSNVEYWTAKFKRNMERDREIEQELENMGWRVVVVWECELKKDKLASTVEYVVEQLHEADAEIAAEKAAKRRPGGKGDDGEDEASEGIADRMPDAPEPGIRDAQPQPQDAQS